MLYDPTRFFSLVNHGKPMVLGSPKLEKHQACYAKTCKELLSVPPCYPVPRTAQPCWGLVDVWSSHYLAVVPSPLMFRLENHPTAEAFLERKPWNKNTGGDVRSVQHTSQTLVTAWWWLEPWNFMTFHILWRIIPTDELIFFRGVETPARTCLVSSSGMGADSLWLSAHSRLRLDA